MNKYFYCYSSKLAHFIRAFDIKYIDVGVNKNTNTKYYLFEKSERLDKVVSLYNEVKHRI